MLKPFIEKDEIFIIENVKILGKPQVTVKPSSGGSSFPVFF
jgi:hypothetical protein